MHTDGLILLAMDAALLAGIFVTLVNIRARIDRIERRLSRKKSVKKKD